MKMKRVLLCMTEREVKMLKDESKELGISLAELVRRIIDKYIGDKDKK